MLCLCLWAKIKSIVLSFASVRGDSFLFNDVFNFAEVTRKVFLKKKYKPGTSFSFENFSILRN